MKSEQEADNGLDEDGVCKIWCRRIFAFRVELLNNHRAYSAKHFLRCLHCISTSHSDHVPLYFIFPLLTYVSLARCISTSCILTTPCTCFQQQYTLTTTYTSDVRF